MLRLRQRWLLEGQIDAQAESLAAFQRHLLLVPEHTWGLDVKTHLDDYVAYDSGSLAAARSRPNFAKMEESWREQRAYLTAAVDALGTSALAAEARSRLAALQPARPSLAGYSQIEPAAAPWRTRTFEIGFDRQSGAIDRLTDLRTGRRWATPAFPLGAISYQAFDESDYARFHRQYVNKAEEIAWWAIPDFTKPGIDAAGAQSHRWAPQVEAIYHRQDEAGHTFLLVLTASEQVSPALGCPRHLYRRGASA